MSRCLFSWTVVLATAQLAFASITDLKQLNVAFTNEADAAEKATWSPADGLDISEKGLGRDGDAASLRDGWIRTKPLALGMSWRAPYAVSVRLVVRPAPEPIKLNSGQTSVPFPGTAYVRYSPDLRHWSTWQALARTKRVQPNERDRPGRYFTGPIQVPRKVREPYEKLLSAYSTLDVPWKSDEEAAVRWMLERDPRFFNTQLPFIGYVEFLFEQGFYGGQRIESLEASVGYGMSGMVAAPRDSGLHTGNEGPWNFRAEEDRPTANDVD
jgi:hypothetical protein